MMRRSLGSSLLLLSVLTLASAACADHRAWTEADEWYKPDKGNSDVAKRKPVKFAAVTGASEEDAEKRLADANFVRISINEAKGMTEHPPATAGKKELYLVRAVYLSPSGRFDVASDEDSHDLYIHHGSLGHHPLKMKRQALIVALGQPPEHVFVSASMAE